MRARRGEARAFLEAITPSNCCVFWPFGKTAAGYGSLGKIYWTRYAHIWVCEKFHGPPPFEGAEAAHECGNPECVNPNHLRWDTHAGNIADRVRHGTENRGERCGTHVLTEAQALQVRKDSRLNRVIAAELGVNQSAISSIKRLENWGWL